MRSAQEVRDDVDVDLADVIHRETRAGGLRSYCIYSAPGTRTTWECSQPISGKSLSRSRSDSLAAASSCASVMSPRSRWMTYLGTAKV